MIKYEKIKKKYGNVGSWAIWEKINKDKKSKFGMGNISFFDNPEHLKLNPNIILVGLNISHKIEKPFSNFHSDYCRAQDYKTRYAVENTLFSGAYMTDIIKDFEEIISGKVMKYLRNNPEFEKKNIISFEEELEYIGAKDPIIIAFGNDCYKILNRNLKEKYKIYKVPHYSSFISKEKLRTAFQNLSNNL